MRRAAEEEGEAAQDEVNVGISTNSTGRRFFLVVAFLAKARRKRGWDPSTTQHTARKNKAKAKAKATAIIVSARHWKEFKIKTLGYSISCCIR